MPGTVLVAGGLFSLVYGFSNAESHHWGSPLTWGYLAVGGLLLAAFAWWQTRAAHPLLPVRVLLDRDRGSSFVAVLITGAGMFGVFLFLTYYLQLNLGFSPTKTGVAFLPMVGALMVTAQLGTTVCCRGSPEDRHPWVAIATVGMAWLTGIGLGSHYASAVLPQLIVIGVGLGLVMPTAMQLATGGVAPEDAGVASATVNAMQQVGGSIGRRCSTHSPRAPRPATSPAGTRPTGRPGRRRPSRATPRPSGGRRDFSPWARSSHSCSTAAAHRSPAPAMLRSSTCDQSAEAEGPPSAGPLPPLW